MSQPDTQEASQIRQNSSPVTMRPCLFYKLIDASIIQDKKMRIPKKFVRKFGGRLSAFARLVLPNCNDWLVKIRKMNHNVWFSDGWSEFVERNSLRVGYLLLFRYEGHADFFVSIYNLSAFEIEYPSVSPTKEKPCSPTDEVPTKQHDESLCLQEDDIETIHVDRNLQQTKNAENSPETLPSTRDIGVQFDGGYKLLESVELQTSLKESEFANVGFQVEAPGTRNGSETMKRSLKAELFEDVDTHAAKKLKLGNPTYQVVLRPSHLGNKGLHLPASFASMIRNTPQFVKIVGCDGKEWQIHCIPSGKHYAKLTRGWVEFLKDNELAVEDVCDFELIKTTEGIVLKVSILRNQNG